MDGYAKENSGEDLPDETLRHDWTELPLSQQGAEVPGTRALVLAARGIPFSLQQEGEKWHLLVPEKELPRARAEIALYEEENRGWPLVPPASSPLADNALASLSLLASLALFHNLTLLGVGGFGREEWLTAGGADAGRILEGEPWRALTALTLHTGGEHLLANMLIGAFFIVPLCRELGLALGWALLIAAGGAGNCLNALVQNPSHLAVGGSTAIFGAIGLLAGLGTRRRLLGRYLPLAAAAALLGLLGSGGENTDLGAHLFGFLAGIPLGMAASLSSSISEPLRRLVGLIAFLAPIVAWTLALGSL